MPSIVKNADAEECLRKLLEAQEYKLTPQRARGETGVDIRAIKDGEQWHIEVIGYKSSGPARAGDFFQVFFRAISRLDDGATHCVIAVPVQARVGLPARARQYREAWRRIARAFPELEIWLVDVENRDYQRTSWEEWLRR